MRWRASNAQQSCGEMNSGDFRHTAFSPFLGAVALSGGSWVILKIMGPFWLKPLVKRPADDVSKSHKSTGAT